MVVAGDGVVDIDDMGPVLRMGISFNTVLSGILLTLDGVLDGKEG
jgi:hypothetical protein